MRFNILLPIDIHASGSNYLKKTTGVRIIVPGTKNEFQKHWWSRCKSCNTLYNQSYHILPWISLPMSYDVKHGDDPATLVYWTIPVVPICHLKGRIKHSPVTQCHHLMGSKFHIQEGTLYRRHHHHRRRRHHHHHHHHHPGVCHVYSIICHHCFLVSQVCQILRRSSNVCTKYQRFLLTKWVWFLKSTHWL